MQLITNNIFIFLLHCQCSLNLVNTQEFEKVQPVSVKDIWVVNISNVNFNQGKAMNFMRNEINLSASSFFLPLRYFKTHQKADFQQKTQVLLLCRSIICKHYISKTLAQLKIYKMPLVLFTKIAVPQIPNNVTKTKENKVLTFF